VKNTLILAIAALSIAQLPMALAEPEVISETGQEQVYVKSIKPAVEGMSSEMIDAAKRFGTYDNLKNTGSPELGRVWIGTVVTKEDGKCTATTTTAAKVEMAPGEPTLNVTQKAVECPA
jgi:hypothetical protein